MRGTLLAAAVCGGLLAGCGSSAPSSASGGTTSTQAPHGPAMTSTGSAGKVGPGGGGKYRATDGAVLFHIRIALVKFFTAKGFAGVTVSCKGINALSASCNVTGTNHSNQTSSAALTLSVDQSNGMLRITHVQS